MKNKRSIYLAFAIALILIPVIILLFRPSKTPPAITPTPTEAQFQPTSIPTQVVQETLINRFKDRKQLSQTDIQAKQKIISLLPTGKVSGTAYQSTSFKVDYVSSPDLLQVEILIRDIDKAKAEAVAWLSAQGMSQDAICFAPVQFYPTFDVMQELKQQGIEFNPLAPGC